MAAPGKRPKTYHFHPEWEEDYVFVYYNSTPICLIRNAKVALAKKANLERHYTSMHAKKYDKDYPAKTRLRSEELKKLKETKPR